MKKYFAAALTIGIATGPASALDAGLGGKVGGLGVSAGVSAGSQGASVGVGASAGGVGGANVGASVGAGNGSVNAGVSAGGNVGNAGVSASGNVGTSGGGLSTGVGLGAASSAENGSATAPGGQAAAATGTASATTATTSATTATASTKTTRQSIVLPPVLRPSKDGQGDLTRGYPFAPLEGLTAKPGTPAAVVQACRAAITSAAKPLGAVRVRAVSAGVLHRRGGALTAPIKVRIDYARGGGIEVRQAQVGCRLNKAGRVIAVI
ncbi:hypothetical protein [Mesorhizobium huakuii]|uniref:Helicase n=1 Tax=Mesorhizobium huakuii TaxID=28104 RepID=A0A7G6SMV0_9HYPH|nr:hypothetical protein [Mesorhizobium huakuii]QND55832.1 hypothetical protein HB778_03565 [Mesorhizobium huakuii]